MAKSLERFIITRATDDFLLTIEDDAGGTIELIASVDQLDMITEELERALDDDGIDDPLDEADDEHDEE